MQIMYKLASGGFKPRAYWCFAKGCGSAHSISSHKQKPEKAKETVNKEDIGPFPVCFVPSFDNFCGGERQWKGK